VEISTGQLKVSTILFDDANIEYNLYSQGGQLYYNNALIGGSIPSDYAFSNLRIEDTLSTMSTFTDYISAPTIDSLRINISTIDFSENRIKLRTNGSPNTIGIGSEAGEGQGDNAIAIGRYAGANNQGTSAIALGDNAGNNGQFNNAIAIGSFAGHEIQGDYAISIGYAVGQYNQASNAIAIGYQAGNHYQSTSAIAIGYQAGVNNQDDYSIAIGHQAGMNAQAASTIILNATGTEVSGIPGQQQSFYVAPVRYDPTTTLSTLFYNPGTYEITYGNPSQGASVSADYAFSTLRIADTLSTTSTFTDFISTANIETSTLSLSYNGSTYPLHTEGANKLYFDTNQVAFTSAFRFESGTISGGSFSGGQASVSFSFAFTTAPIVMLTFAGAPNEVATLFTSGVTGNGFNANQQQFSGDLTNPTSPPYIAPSGYDVSWLAYGQ
jgi:hypothetical protein